MGPQQIGSQEAAIKSLPNQVIHSIVVGLNYSTSPLAQPVSFISFHYVDLFHVEEKCVLEGIL